MNSAFPEPGEVFASRYRIESLLGSGGFSRVYRAVQLGIERVVALKVMRPESAGPEDCKGSDDCLDSLARRFEREARAISELRSPHTITMYDFGRDAERGVLYMVLEYIDGQDLEAVAQEHGALAPARVVGILEKVLRSLHEAHQLGMVHRDIKPQNIMLYEHMGTRDCVKLLDFGIAKHIDEAMREHTRELTSEGMLLGTPTYMAPEYISGDAPLPASDLYSLGLVVFKLLTGHPAIKGSISSIQILGQHLSPRSFVLPADADICPELRAVVNTMLAKDLGRRYSSAKEVLDALDELSHRSASGYRGVASSEEPHTEPLEFLATSEPELFSDTSPEPSKRISDRFSAVAFVPEASSVESTLASMEDVPAGGLDSSEGRAEDVTSVDAARDAPELHDDEGGRARTSSSGPLWVFAACAVIACSLGVWALSFGPERARVRSLEPVARADAASPSPPLSVETVPPKEVSEPPSIQEAERLDEPEAAAPVIENQVVEARRSAVLAPKRPRGVRPRRRAPKKKAVVVKPASDELGAELELLRRGFE